MENLKRSIQGNEVYFPVKERVVKCKSSVLQHCDDKTKLAMIDLIHKICQGNDIPEKYIKKHSDCSESSVSRVWNPSSSPSMPNWSTIFNVLACVIEKSEDAYAFFLCVKELITYLIGDSAHVECTFEEPNCIYIQIDFAK